MNVNAFDIVGKYADNILEDKCYSYLAGSLQAKLGITLNRIKYESPELYKSLIKEYEV